MELKQKPIPFSALVDTVLTYSRTTAETSLGFTDFSKVFNHHITFAQFNVCVDQCIKYRFDHQLTLAEFNVLDQVLSEFSTSVRKAIPLEKFEELSALLVYGSGLFRLVLSTNSPNALFTLADLEILIYKILALRERDSDIVSDVYEQPIIRFISAAKWHLHAPHSIPHSIPHHDIIKSIGVALDAVIYK